MGKSRDIIATEDRFVARVGAFMAPLRDYQKEPLETVKDWLGHVFTEFLYRRTGAAFAPFNDWFEGQLDFPEAFHLFVKQEVEDQRVGKFDARALIVNALASRLSESLRDTEPFDLDEPGGRIYVSDFPMLLFKALRLVDMERACEWAAAAARSNGGFAGRWTLNEQPFPVALYYEMRGGDMTGPSRRAFNEAMLEWCDGKREMEGVGTAAFSVCLDVLRGRTAESRVDMVNRRQELFHIICRQIDVLDELKGSDVGLERAAGRLRDAFGKEGAERVREMDDAGKQEWKKNPLLVEAFSEDLQSQEVIEQNKAQVSQAKSSDAWWKSISTGGVLCDAA